MVQPHASETETIQQIKQIFERENTAQNFVASYSDLANCYADLSFTQPYDAQDLFPKILPDYQISPRSRIKAQKLQNQSQKKWTADGSGLGEEYFSCREAFLHTTGIDVGRDYTYPDNMSSKEFQQSFNSTRINKDISTACLMMAQNALLGNYDEAFAYKLFLEREKAKNTHLIDTAYQKFWEANPHIKGYDELKNIQNFNEKREFLMGVASEIPLDDIAAYLKMSFHNDKSATIEIEKNNTEFEQIFHHHPAFFITNKTWNRCIAPVIEKRNQKDRLTELQQNTALSHTNN